MEMAQQRGMPVVAVRDDLDLLVEIAIADRLLAELRSRLEVVEVAKAGGNRPWQ